MIAFPLSIRQVSFSSYSQGNFDSSFSQIGQRSASCFSSEVGFLTFGFMLSTSKSMKYRWYKRCKFKMKFHIVGEAG